MTTPTIVSGAVSTVSELGKDEAWLQGWLKEQPSRMGLGEMEVTDGAGDDDDRSFVATDDERCFSVDVRLGEMEASHGFQLLDNWARNRVRHPDKTHVAVLVTESTGDRYRTTLQALADHLPLVVVELAVWRGDSEAIVVPHVALASADVDLGTTAAAKAAEALARVGGTGDVEAAADAPQAFAELEVPEMVAAETPEPAEANAESAEANAESAEANAESDEYDVPENKDDTGISDPWGLPRSDTGDGTSESYGAGHRLLTKIGH
jgi:hypothetical protein